ncbi:MAG: phosphoribosylformylglycinamidine synthase I [Candidatus Kariarchaeaceae archaeon]|jgi:phosphoribosylformylglycinamidine synthase
MQIGVTCFPGTNNEHETKRAIEDFGAKADIINHYDSEKLSDYDGIWLAGGFSYGDIIRAGAIASLSDVMDMIKSLDRPVIGTCNGFQILTEAKILPGALIPNRSTRFICRWISLKIPENNSYLCDLAGNILQLPIAHFEGNYWNKKPDELSKQIIAYYTTTYGEVSFEINPNGSVSNIAGLASLDGKIVGMMPHPERACFKYQGSTDGRRIINAFLQEVKR